MKPQGPGRWWEVLFWCLLGLHALPVLVFHWFPTLDGPAHLYNARIISDLLRGDPTTSRYFELNPFPEPNWLGHALIMLVLQVAPAWVAEKVVVLLYIIGLPLVFRAWLRHTSPGSPWAALLVFPFIHAMPLRMGFLNFCLGVPIMLWTLREWQRCLDEGRQIWRVGLLLVLLYFAHLATYLLGLSLMLAWWVWRRLMAPPRGARNVTTRHLLHLTIIAAPTLVLTCAYLITHRHGGEAFSSIGRDDLLAWMMDGRAFITYTRLPELFWARVFGIVPVGILIAALLKRRAPTTGEENAHARFWAIVSAGLVALYFLVPNGVATGGYVSIRMLFFISLFLSIAAGHVVANKWVIQGAMAALVMGSFFSVRYHFRRTAELNTSVREYCTVLPHVSPGDVILPINYDDNWMHANWSSYVGASAHVVVLDNFSAHTPHFPVRWTTNGDPSGRLGNFATSLRPCVDLKVFRRMALPSRPLVILWHQPQDEADSCISALQHQCKALCSPMYSSPRGGLGLLDCDEGRGAHP